MKLFTQLGWFFLREWRQYLGAILLLIFIALLQLIPPRLVGIVIDNVIDKDNNTFNILFFWIGIMIITAVIVYFLRYIWRILLFGSAYKLAVELRNRLYHLLSNQQSSFYLTHRTGDLIARATNDVDCVVFAAGEGVLTLVDSLVMGCSVLLIMNFQISWKLTILVLFPMLIMAFLVKQDGQKLHEQFFIAQTAFSLLNNNAQENITNIRMIKAFGLEKRQLSIFTNVAKDTSDKNMNVAKIDARFDPIIYLSVGLSNLLAIVSGSYLVLNKTITIGQLTSFIMYLGLMVWPMLALAWMFNIVERGSAAYIRIINMLEKKSEIQDGSLNLPRKDGVISISIKKFCYPNTKNIVLENIDFILSPGRILGICGPTGSGKSTLLSLILRQFDINDGEIRFHNILLKQIMLDQWRSKFALVSQTPFLFSDSIANNISLGKPDATISQIEKVAKIACIHNDIILLPNGYNTEVGERGFMLSGGQKQRLSIARALILEADILVLDDALSAVDRCTETKILQNLMDSDVYKTMIITAHRLSTLKYSDEIIVLNKGRIIQRGNHVSLLKKSGWYRDTYSYQKIEISIS